MKSCWRVFAASGLLLWNTILAAQTPAAPLDGRALYMDPKKGNCAACHKAPYDTEVKIASTVAKPLVNIAKRFDPTSLRAAIADYRTTSTAAQATSMPPYGPHRILSDAEIDAIVAYVIQL